MKITDFKMALPKVSALKLPPNVAVSAINCEADTGVLRPTKGTSSVQALAKPGDLRSIYKCGDTWLAFTGATSFQKALAGGVYFTDGVYPKYTDEALCISGGVPSLYPSTTYRMGATRPASALTVGLSQYDIGEAYGDIIGTASYYYTYVHYIDADYAEESAPSPPTIPVSVRANEQVTLTGFLTSTEAGVNNLYFRVYRSLGGSDYEAVPTGRDGNGDFTFDMPVSSASFIDIDSTTGQIYQNINILCETEGWDSLPDDAANLCEYQNGIFAATSGKKVLISEMFVPYAFPQGVSSTKDYSHTFATAPTRVMPYRDMLIVGTNGNPWVISGSEPGQTYQQELPYNQACVGDMCRTEVGVFYPSPDGLVLCDGVTAEPVTQDTYTIAQWRALNPSTLKMFYHDNQIIGFFTGTSAGFKFDFKSGKTVETISLGSSVFYAGHLVPGEDRLYLLLLIGATYYVHQWHGGSDNTMTYTGIVRFAQEQPMFEAFRVVGDFDEDEQLDLRITIDGVTTTLSDVSDAAEWTGISGWVSEFQYTLYGNAQVSELRFGAYPGELE